MDSILLIVTTLSLAMAASMAIVVVKLLHQERARSEARVAALSALESDHTDPTPRVAVAQARRVRNDRPVAPARLVAPDARPIAAQPQATFSAQVNDLEIRPPADGTVAGISQLFSHSEPRAPWGPRLAVIASLTAILAVIGFGMATRGTRPASTAAGSSPAASPVAGPAAAIDPAPLELLSLRHEQEPERLVISGIVQNPRNGSTLTRVVATAVVFRSDGSFVTSGRAPLDFTTLSPGVESPFVVSVPVTGAVARYRIGFRTDDGRVIAHVDRRGPDALAQK